MNIEDFGEGNQIWIKDFESFWSVVFLLINKKEISVTEELPLFLKYIKFKINWFKRNQVYLDEGGEII